MLPAFVIKFMDKRSNKKRYLIKTKESNEIKKNLFSNFDIIQKFADDIFETFINKGKILVCGNGGSASDSQHIATEFTIRFDKKYNRKSLPAICLGMDAPSLTACSNDYHFDKIFSRPFESLANKNDVLLCLSTSGNSKNILKVLDAAKKQNVKSYALLGCGGGLAKKKANYKIIVPSKNVPLIQETHMFLMHFIIEIIENLLSINDRK